MAYRDGLPTTPGLGGINENLFTAKVSRQIYEEYIRTTPLINLMSSDMNAPIYRHKMMDGDGFVFRIPRLQSLDFKNPVLGLDQRRGKEYRQHVDSDEVKATLQSFGLELENRDVMRLGTNVQLGPHARSQLVQAAAQNLNWSIFKAATIDNYDVKTQKPVFDRVHLCGIGYAPDGDGTINTLGRTGYNALAGLDKVSDVLSVTGGANYNEGGLGMVSLYRLKTMADQGGHTHNDSEARVRPAWIKNRDGFAANEFYYFADPDSLLSLFQDPLFRESTIARGAILPEQPQIISGADYIGKVRGIHIYSVPELTEFRFRNENNTHLTAWNLLLGAGALTVGWYKEPYLLADTFDVAELVQKYYLHEYRGQKALKYPGRIEPNKLVEQGIIHSLCRLT